MTGITPAEFTFKGRYVACDQNIAEYANPSNTYGMIVYVILIIAFAYFYAFVQVNV
jgi:preprotein translocase subunit SecY